MTPVAAGAAPAARPSPVPRPPVRSEQPTPSIDIVIPVYNEERALEPSVRRLHAYLRESFPFSARITIADNASGDGTWEVASRLADQLPDLRLIRLNEKGRGRALAAAWLTSDAGVVAYMDVDLSTGLAALLPLVAPLLSGHSDVAIGSRLTWGAHVVRGRRRDLISRAYNLLLRITLWVHFSDAQCGFKAVRTDVARRLLPAVENRSWFFDTELLVLAQRAGLRIHEVPVDWVDDPDSRVDVVATALEDLRGVWRLVSGRRSAVPLGLPGQLARFAAVGTVCTIAYAALYLVLRGGLPAPLANSAALLVTAVANTAANRRLTFGVSGPAGLLRAHAGGLAALGIGLALTSASVVVLHAAVPRPERGLEILVLSAVNAFVTGARFLVLRALVFHPRTQRFRRNSA